ncbi:MAG: ArsR family transcriptional regulator [Archaeoglobaceae archaeon]
MAKRAKLVNDIVDLIPILQLFSTRTYRNVYEALLLDRMTFEELESKYGDCRDALKVLKHAGMLEAKWRMPSEPSEKPRKEYHVSYTHLSASLYTPLKDINTILEIISMPDDEFEEAVEKIIGEIKAGKKSVPYISKDLSIDSLYIRAVAKKSLDLVLKGQHIEIAEDEEI